MTENKATIKQTGGAVRIFDKDEKQIKVSDGELQSGATAN